MKREFGRDKSGRWVEQIFQDAYGGRIVLRKHMLNPDKLVLFTTPQPVEMTLAEFIEVCEKLTKFAQEKSKK